MGDLTASVEARLAGLASGNYRRNTDLVLGGFVDFLHERGVDRVEDVSVLDCRRYAQQLRARVRDPDDPLSAASAHENGPYFTSVRAFFEWCVADERCETNPARPNRVRTELPEYRGDNDQQFWTPDARNALLAFVDERVRAALEEGEEGEEGGRKQRDELDVASRDRALVTTLALTGVRGAEVFRDPRDDARPGLTWRDVDLDRGVAHVLGKSRERESVALPARVVTVLSRHRRIQEPPTAEWPVFSTRHAPSLARTVREGLRERGHPDEDIEARLVDSTAREVLYEEELPPPAISKNGARSLLERLCDAADVHVDGEYLKPHGARRGLGDLLYGESAELAQETLRHRSIETTHAAYRANRAADRRARIDRVLDADGGRASDGAEE